MAIKVNVCDTFTDTRTLTEGKRQLVKGGLQRQATGMSKLIGSLRTLMLGGKAKAEQAKKTSENVAQRKIPTEVTLPP